MKRHSLLNKLFAVALTAMVLFTVSVRETHYLFADHQGVHEHCQNHLHSDEEHSHCAVCKFDVSLFTDEILPIQNSSFVFTKEILVGIYQSPLTNSLRTFVALRGPPALV